MNPDVLVGQSPVEAIKDYFALIGHQQPLEVGNFVLASLQYDDFLFPEADHTPTQTMIGVAEYIQDVAQSYRPELTASPRVRLRYLGFRAIQDVLLTVAKVNLLTRYEATSVTTFGIETIDSLYQNNPQLLREHHKTLRANFGALAVGATTPSQVMRAQAMHERIPAPPQPVVRRAISWAINIAAGKGPQPVLRQAT